MNVPVAKRFFHYDSQERYRYERLAVSIDDVMLDVRGSAAALQVVSDVFRTHATRGPVPSGAISVTLDDEADRGNPHLRAVDVAAVCDQVLRAFYEASALTVTDGAVVVRGEESICLIGDRPDVSVALAGALLARGWRLLSAHHVLIDLETCTLRPFHRALWVSSNRLSSLTPEIRAACERSPWCVAHDGEVIFYGIDPATQFGDAAWSSDGRLTRILWVDDTRALVPSIHGEDSWDVLASATVRSQPTRNSFDGSAPHTIALRHVRGGRIRLGQLQDAAEAIDAWVDA